MKDFNLLQHQNLISGSLPAFLSAHCSRLSSSFRLDDSLKPGVSQKHSVQTSDIWTGNTTAPNPTDSVSRSSSHHMTDRVQSNKSESRKQDLSQKTKPSPTFSSLQAESIEGSESRLRTSQVRSNKFWVKDCKIRVQDKPTSPRPAGSESNPTLTVWHQQSHTSLSVFLFLGNHFFPRTFFCIVLFFSFFFLENVFSWKCFDPETFFPRGHFKMFHLTSVFPEMFRRLLQVLWVRRLHQTFICPEASCADSLWTYDINQETVCTGGLNWSRWRFLRLQQERRAGIIPHKRLPDTTVRVIYKISEFQSKCLEKIL